MTSLIVRPGGPSCLSSPSEEHLVDVGLRREYITTVTSFVVVAHLLAATDLVGSSPHSIVALMSQSLPNEAVAIPVAVPDFDINLIWHRRDQHDAAHQWLRQQILESFDDLRRAAGTRAEWPTGPTPRKEHHG